MRRAILYLIFSAFYRKKKINVDASWLGTTLPCTTIYGAHFEFSRSPVRSAGRSLKIVLVYKQCFVAYSKLFGFQQTYIIMDVYTLRRNVFRNFCLQNIEIQRRIGQCMYPLRNVVQFYPTLSEVYIIGKRKIPLCYRRLRIYLCKFCKKELKLAVCLV